MNRRLSLFNVTSLVIGFAFLYLPILLLVIYSFNASRLVTVWGGFSTQWYGALFRNEGLIEAAWVTLRIALLSATLATVLGTLAALALTLLAGLLSLTAPAGAAAPSGPPGPTLIGRQQLSKRHQLLRFADPMVGAANVEVLLPDHYDPSGRTRYPVLWLLHGASGSSSDWVEDGAAELDGRLHRIDRQGKGAGSLGCALDVGVSLVAGGQVRVDGGRLLGREHVEHAQRGHLLGLGARQPADAQLPRIHRRVVAGHGDTSPPNSARKASSTRAASSALKPAHVRFATP